MLGAAIRFTVGADERLGFRPFVDYEETGVPLNNAFDLRVLMPGNDDESVVVGPHALVVRRGHVNDHRTRRPSALADEVKLSVVGQNLESLTHVLDPLVHLAQKSLVPRGALVAAVHSARILRWRSCRVT